MASTPERAQGFALIAGALCLDFANTLGGFRGGVTQENLRGYDDLLEWSLLAGTLGDRLVQRCRREAERRPAQANAVFARARNFGEAVYSVFSAVAAGRRPPLAGLAALNTELRNTLTQARVVATPEGFGWGWSGDEDALDRVLWPVARSAAELLTSDRRELVRECASDTCGWLFLDTSRNHSRRWCDMRGCGNRSKVRRHRQRRGGAGRKR